MPCRRLCFHMYYGLFAAFCLLRLTSPFLHECHLWPSTPSTTHISSLLTLFNIFLTSPSGYFSGTLESLYKVFTPKSHWHLGETALTSLSMGTMTSASVSPPVLECGSSSTYPHVPSFMKIGTFLLKIIVRHLGFFFFFYCLWWVQPFYCLFCHILARKYSVFTMGFL